MIRMEQIATYTDHELQGLANDVKDLVITALSAKGHVTGPVENLQRRYQIVIVKKGFFGRLFDKIFKTPEESNVFQMRVVEIVE